MSNVFAHFLEQAAVISSAVFGEPVPIVYLDGDRLMIIRICISIDAVALTPGLGYIPSFGHLGLTKLGLTELGVDTMTEALAKISAMSQQKLHEFCKKTGTIVRNGMAVMCRRSDNSCQSVVALDLTGTGGGAAAFYAELQTLLTDLRKKCSACLRNDTLCIRTCDNNCVDFCDGCRACQCCQKEGCICKRVTIDTCGMDCASVQWSVMQSSPADVTELGLNAGFVPDIGHTVRSIRFDQFYNATTLRGEILCGREREKGERKRQGLGF